MKSFSFLKMSNYQLLLLAFLIFSSCEEQALVDQKNNQSVLATDGSSSLVDPQDIINCPYKSITLTGGFAADPFAPNPNYANWFKPGHATISNNQYAMAEFPETMDCNDNSTTALYISNFGFGSWLNGMIIKGMEVKIEKHRANLICGGTQLVVDGAVRLYHPKLGTSTNHADIVTDWPVSDQVLNYGSCSDVWGLNWTGIDLSDPKFGVYFSVLNQSCLYFPENEVMQAFVDNVTVTIYYVLP